MKYSLVSQGDGLSTLTLVGSNGEFEVVRSEHPSFKEILDRAIAGDESALGLVDVGAGLSKKFETLSERMKYTAGHILFDGDEVTGPLVDQILRFLDEGVEDWKPLVAFFEKVKTNPNPESVEQFYNWLKSHNFTINEDGDVVGYKGVNTNLTSIHSGPAIVDGVAQNGYIPNQPGSVIEMARSEVAFNPDEHCSTGLHIGTYEYARSFGSVVLEVTFNPRDVVSVPSDYSGAKLRACRYTVVGPVDKQYDTVVRSADVDDEDDECYDCGYNLDDCECDY